MNMQGSGSLVQTDRKTNDAMCWNTLKTPVSSLPGSVYVHGHMVWKWERGSMCVRGKNRRPRACVYERVRDRQRVAGAGKAVCTVRTVHMAVCTCPQLCFYEEPSTSFHSSGGSLRPPEPQWARVPLSVSISSSSHLFRTRALVLSRCSKAERDSSGTEM